MLQIGIRVPEILHKRQIFFQVQLKQGIEQSNKEPDLVIRTKTNKVDDTSQP